MNIKKSDSTKANNQYYMPPGSVITNAESCEIVDIEIINFNENSFEQRHTTNAKDILVNTDPNIITWYNINGIHNTKLIEDIGKKFNIHALTLEDIANVDQRPKFEDFNNYNVAIMKLLYFENTEIKTEQLCIILTDNYIITFQELQGGDPFNAIRLRLKQAQGRVRKCGADYLAYALIDAVVDSYFVMLDGFEKKLDDYDTKLLQHATPELLKQLHHSRRELLFMRKSITPMRELILSMSRQDDKFFKPTTQLYMRDLLDHQIRITESIENYREIIAEMIESYMSSSSFKMNEVMKVLTVISTFFIPLTFIVGVYGMNFDYMPELHSRYGYAFVWLAMLTTVIILLIYFRGRKWL